LAFEGLRLTVRTIFTVRPLDLIFSGPLAEMDESIKCKYLLLWIGDKGRDIYTGGCSKMMLKSYNDKFK